MLPAKYRLKKEKDFKRIYKKGKGAKQRFLMLRFIPNSLDNNRFGIIVSKKVANRANERNLIKRRIRGVIKEFLPEMQGGLDMAIIVLRGIKKENSFQEIEQSLEDLFLKTGIINREKSKQ